MQACHCSCCSVEGCQDSDYVQMCCLRVNLRMPLQLAEEFNVAVLITNHVVRPP
jgi:hypothetical protein